MKKDLTIHVIPRSERTGVAVTPTCAACGVEVDLSKPDHHVCAPDADGKMQPMTAFAARDVQQSSVH